MITVIKDILYNETSFIKWKIDGCQPFEKIVSEETKQSIDSLSNVPSSWIFSTTEIQLPRNINDKTNEMQKLLNEQNMEFYHKYDMNTVIDSIECLAQETPNFDKFILVSYLYFN